MKLSELMKDIVPSTDFNGFVTADDMVLAIDTKPEQDSGIDDYAVVQTGIAGIDPSLKSETKENQYIRSGVSSTKTGTQRQFRISGDMFVGDEAQDFMLSHRIKFGTGQTVVVNYVFFNMLTGIGEKGKAAVAVNSDGSGNSGENAGISISLMKSGDAPEEFIYSSKAVSTRLSDISGLTLSPEFDPRITSYKAETSNASDTISVTAEDGENAKAAILLDGKEQTGASTWSEGENMLVIIVTNGTAAPAAYTVKVTKK